MDGQALSETTIQNRKEWGRDRDVDEVFSLKKGTLRTLEKQGKIRSAILKVSGENSKIKLWEFDSIRELLRSNSIITTEIKQTKRGVSK